MCARDSFLSFFKMHLFIFGCVGVSVATHRLSLAEASRGYSSLLCRASHCCGFSCCGAQALGIQASVAAAHRL